MMSYLDKAVSDMANRAWKAVFVGFLAGLFVIIGLEVVIANDSPGPEKKLFDGRWYQEVAGDDYDSWMTLSMSQLWYFCDTILVCESKWQEPANQAIVDGWNQEQTTVRFQIMPDLSLLYDVNILIYDTLFDNPNILGFAARYDLNGDFCGLDNCTIRWGEVWIGDDAHILNYGTKDQRQSTIAHEVGHLLALRHESVNEDETVQYVCGEDNTGAIPHSIMALLCTDPVKLGGLGETYIHAWDVCGVNHAYHDPTIGFAGCDSLTAPTPTSTSTPTYTATPDVTPDAEGTPTGEPSPTAGPSATDTSTATPVSTPITVPTVLGPRATALPTWTPAPTWTPVPTWTPNTGPTDTPTPTFTDTPRPTNTRTPTPTGLVGDASCDGAVNPLDAALILQLAAGIIPALPCPGGGDTNGDGVTNPLDAALILQFSAGMISRLPP